jgi:nucleoside-diphosphate-sugar epimerase
MSNPPVALLAGATGAVGLKLLGILLARDDGTRVLTIGRRAPSVSHPCLEHREAALDEFSGVLLDCHCTEAFCCLGTTMKKAGSRAAFRAVDLDGVAAFAHAARVSGAQFFGLVSSAGASPDASNFYLRTKGEAEAAVAALHFPSLAIMQPGLLRGARGEHRTAERLGQLAAPFFDRLLIGALARYRSVHIEAVAAALDAAARRRDPGTIRLDAAAIEALAGVG